MVCSREVRIYPLQKSSLEPYEQLVMHVTPTIQNLFKPAMQYYDRQSLW
jgi:hypothetical protein